MCPSTLKPEDALYQECSGSATHLPCTAVVFQCLQVSHWLAYCSLGRALLTPPFMMSHTHLNFWAAQMMFPFFFMAPSIAAKHRSLSYGFFELEYLVHLTHTHTCTPPASTHVHTPTHLYTHSFTLPHTYTLPHTHTENSLLRSRRHRLWCQRWSAQHKHLKKCRSKT